MGQYDFKGQFPTDAYIRAMQQRPLLEQQIASQHQQSQQDALNQAGQGFNAIAENRRRMAAAMTMAQDPDVQTSLGGGISQPGTSGRDPNDAMAQGPGGAPVTPSMTAMGGSGQAPVQNTANATSPNLTPDQIANLLPLNGDEDYTGAMQKAGGLANLRQKLMNQNNTSVITTDGSGNITGTQTVSGARRPTVIGPKSSPSGGAGSRGGRSAADYQRDALVRTHGQLQGAVNNTYGALQQANQAKLAAFEKANPSLGIPQQSGGGRQGPSGLDPQTLAEMSQHPEGSKITLVDGRVFTIQNGQPVQSQ